MTPVRTTYTDICVESPIHTTVKSVNSEIVQLNRDALAVRRGVMASQLHWRTIMRAGSDDEGRQ